MRRRTKLLLIRRSLFLVLIWIGHLLQNTSGFFPEIFGVRAYFLISLTVVLGLFERELPGALYGIFAGALWDSVSGLGDGFNALYLMLIGAVCGILINTVMRNNLRTALLLSGAAHLLYALLYLVFFLLAEGVDSVGFLFWRYLFPSVLYSLAFTPILYFFVRAVMQKTKLER